MKKFSKYLSWLILAVLLACHSEDEEFDRNIIAPEAESNELTTFLSEEELAFYNFYLDSMFINYQSTYTLEELIDQLNDTIVEGMYIGNPERLSDDYFIYEALQRMINKEEIQSLIASDSPIKRYYGFRLHAGKERTDLLNILIGYLNDTTNIRPRSGYLLYGKKLINMMVELAPEAPYQSGSLADFTYQNSPFQLTNPEIKQLKRIAN